jgi:hypothetical protein
VDQVNFQTISKAISYLKAKETKSLKYFDSSSNNFLEDYYRDFVDQFYDSAFLKDTADKHPLIRLHGQLSLLYNIDHFLDVLPLDSIFIAPLSFFDAEEAGSDPDLTLIIYFKIDGKLVNIHSLIFNENGRLKAIGPFLDFNGEYKGIDIESFYKRQKGYIQMKERLIKF